MQGFHEVNKGQKKQLHRLVMNLNRQDRRKKGKPGLEGTSGEFDTNEERLWVAQLIEVDGIEDYAYHLEIELRTSTLD